MLLCYCVSSRTLHARSYTGKRGTGGQVSCTQTNACLAPSLCHKYTRDPHCISRSLTYCSLNWRPVWFRNFRWTFWFPQNEPTCLLSDIFPYLKIYQNVFATIGSAPYPRTIVEKLLALREFLYLDLATTSCRRGGKRRGKEKDAILKGEGGLAPKSLAGFALPEMQLPPQASLASYVPVINSSRPSTIPHCIQ